MSAPFANQPPPASPFNPNPRPAGSSSGCGKPLLIGCGGVIVIFMAVIVLLVVKGPELMPGMVRWIFAKQEAQMMLQLPPDTTAEDRRRLHAAFASAVATINAQRATPIQMQAVQHSMVEFLRKEKRTRQDVLNVTVALEALAGKTPPAVPDAAPPPVPAPEGGSSTSPRAPTTAYSPPPTGAPTAA